MIPAAGDLAADGAGRSCYHPGVRHTLRAFAVLAVVLGLAALPRPVERFGDSSEPPAGIGPAGKRSATPAIRAGAGLERRAPHALAGVLPPAAGRLHPPAAVAVLRRERAVVRLAQERGRANGPRAPPPAA